LCRASMSLFLVLYSGEVIDTGIAAGVAHEVVAA
jgi:hypothetical protein